MRILLLTTITPTQAVIDYKELTDGLKREDMNLISIPFFAEIEALNNDKLYVPTVFSMYRAMTKTKVKEKIYDKKHTVIIGNSYKSEKFDIILSLGNSSDDYYTKMIRDSKEFEKFNLLAEAEKLYDWNDAEINLPTIQHVILFLEGVGNEQIQSRAKRSNIM